MNTVFVGTEPPAPPVPELEEALVELDADVTVTDVDAVDVPPVPVEVELSFDEHPKTTKSGAKAHQRSFMRVRTPEGRK